jgi:hypothetical protein
MTGKREEGVGIESLRLQCSCDRFERVFVGLMESLRTKASY